MTQRVPVLLIVLSLVAALLLSTSRAHSQGRHSDVMVTVANDKVVALPAAGGGIEEGLGLNESVITSVARGQTGFAQTSTRLLGFSSELRRWTEIRLNSDERVERHHILPRLIVVQTAQQICGFQEGRGHWTSEPLGARETVKELRGRGNVAVVITSDRAIAFSSYTGGFFSVAWSIDERVASIDETNDAVMVRTSTRLLAFRSQTTEWTEVK